MKEIKSVHNGIISEIAKLKNTKQRKASGLFCSEGIKLVREVISCGLSPVYCFISEHFDISNLPCEINSEIIYCISEQVMKKISVMTSLPDIILVAKEKIPLEIPKSEKTVLALDCIQDPLNLGAILRSAEAFGIKNVLLGDGCCDAYSQKVLRGAMGSVFRLNLMSTNLEKELILYKEKGYTVIGTGLDREYKTVDKLSDYKKKVIIIGNEGNGISEKVQSCCHFGMFIPMTGKNESLNAAVAASIIMWENQRQTNE